MEAGAEAAMTRIYVVNRNQGDKPGLTNQDLRKQDLIWKTTANILPQDVLEKVATDLKPELLQQSS